ncbi:MAG: DoxX family protein [Gemmatimonadaceae bacterium]
MPTTSPSIEPDTTTRTANRVLWTIQIILTLLYLFTGITKLVLPIDKMQGPVVLPGLFLRFIGVCEVLGALGLLLPGLTGIRRALTPLAAACLVPIMIGATVVTIMGGQFALALMPAVVGVLVAYVAYGRRAWWSA